MLFPLVVLAGLSIVGGVIMLPEVSWLPDEFTGRLEHWLEPVVEFGERNLDGTWAGEHTTLLMLIATAASVLGIAVAWLVYQRHRIKAVEPKILAEAWYYDRAVTDFMGGPGEEAFEGAAWFDRTVVDGTVEGAGRAVQAAAGELRKGQTGFVRGYAAIIGVGVVVVLGWFVLVRGML